LHYFFTNFQKHKKMRPKKYFVYAALLAFIFTSVGCSLKVHKTDNTMQHEEHIPIPTANNKFAFDLLNEIPYEDDNMVVSPFSISTALAMTYTGAREATLEEMAAVMHFDRNQDRFHLEYGEYLASLNELAANNIQLNIANSLWAQEDYHFLDSFFEINKQHYDSETFQVNFRTNREQVRADINDWVYDETREKIKDLIAPGVLTDDTRLVLVNAIHFFGPWLTEFDPDVTRENIFYPLDAQPVMADFMHRSEHLNYYQDEQLQALEIPYTGEGFSILLVLPQEGIPLQEIEKEMNAASFAEIIAEMQHTEVDVFVPKYEAETKLDLEQTLMAMGMYKPFNREADFSGMTGDLDLKIDKVIHQAMIEVAEEGTEAAAATAVVIIRKTSIDPDPRTVFMANRPFLFFIKDNTHNSILFAGRVMNPAQ
jgi:serpin B